ncbi:amidohydrolase family protein [Microbulbifer bruguierae]|uniref:Amidohydrolase family protein n=1 Tax=Microbulbifer bruguierae TaxID=3029061 RepID=A0ABY8NGP0_9GAMM|nr:amidohydrolase family protein [Microbulbifer bruguierae]WGL17212.1 amidohydrolase family protein [Microbulbifer bruguierae]
MRLLQSFTASLILSLTFCIVTMAQDAQSKHAVLITNARIFDGQNEKLADGMSVLVEGNKISQIAKSIPAPAGATVIDANGKVLMPGLSDMHWHVMFNAPAMPVLLTADIGYLTLLAGQSAHDDLMRGFTTVRDVGGNSFAVKRAIDGGLIPGPRIYPSGPMISQSSGHSDNRPRNEPGHETYLENNHMLAVADGVPEVMTAVRRNLRMGATQIKLAAGGGVSSDYDPLDVTEYTFEELKAAVDVAKTWNTYVAVHVNTDVAVRQAIAAGVISIEHGFLMEEGTLKLMADKGVWFSMQPLLNDEDAIYFPPGSANETKWIEVTDGTDKVIKLAKKYGVKTAFGTDVLFDPALGKKHGKLLAKLKRWYTPYEALKMATYDNAQLVKLCGPRDQYPGEIGVVKEGALADLLLVDGNPLENLDLVADPEKNFVMIMKDGVIYKNTVN